MVARWYRTVPDVLADLAHQHAIAHCFFGIALRSGGGTARHCTRLAALWADIDAKLWPDAADPPGAAYAALLAAPVPPSIVIASGGGWQPYWLLDRPAEVQAERARLERLNRALARAVCGPDRRPDPVQDVARILRLPGSLNHKYAPPRPVHVALFEPERRYSLEQIEQGLAATTPWALRAEVVRSVVFPIGQQVPSTACRLPHNWERRVRPHAQWLLESTGACGYRSPSEADAAVAASLIGAGLTADETYALLLDSARGRDALARKGARYQHAYWRRTVEHAARFVGPVIICQGIRVHLGRATYVHERKH